MTTVKTVKAPKVKAPKPPFLDAIDLKDVYKVDEKIKESKTDVVKVVFVRHGESTWNKCGKFTGWIDVPLSDGGRQESKDAGKALKDLGYEFDVAYTSMLDRATETCDLILENMGLDEHT
jgi:alpha-amylase/alpha-mannosidase (GH57 family)